MVMGDIKDIFSIAEETKVSNKYSWKLMKNLCKKWFYMVVCVVYNISLKTFLKES
jgi:hypothetical protein